MLKLRFKRSYRSQSGKTVFVYLVSGKAGDLESYKEYCGDNIRHEDDDESKPPLYFTTQFAGESATLAPNQEGNKYYVDRSEDDKINSLIEQHAGSALGVALAQAKAQELINAMRKSTPVAAPVTKTTEEKTTDDLGGL
jgi:hypothetical protein